MNYWLWIPLPGRLAVLFLVGACLGAIVNIAVARFGFARAGIGPWFKKPEPAPRRSPLARVPVLGWLLLRPERPWHGRGFFVAPLATEVFMAAAVPVLYWYEVVHHGLVPPTVVIPPQPLGLMVSVHLQFAAHVILLTFMMAATVIDIDEQIIPDAITVPGTIVGLLLAFFFPWSHLTFLLGPVFTTLTLTSPEPFPASLAAGRPGGLVVALTCYWIWCLGLLPRPWRTRRGYTFAARLLAARMCRTHGVGWTWLLGVVGSVAIVFAWNSSPSWPALVSSLVGVFGGGVIIWLVRVIGTAVMRREAMGFGDVTLLAMIGAYLGWQPCLVIFFMAPFAGLALGVVQLIVRRENVLPYGPFLCLATCVVVVRWQSIWEWAAPAFRLGWIVPAAILASLAALGAMLAIWKALADLARPARS